MLSAEIGFKIDEDTLVFFNEIQIGKVEFLKMYPLNFKEYLLAEKEDLLVEILEKNDYNIIKPFKSKLENYFKIYCYVGGMPEVVQKFIDTKNFEIATNTQKEILKSYDLDFSKHTSGEKLEKIRMVWNSIPMQLTKDNKKFKYSEIKRIVEQKTMKKTF